MERRGRWCLEHMTDSRMRFHVRWEQGKVQNREQKNSTRDSYAQILEKTTIMAQREEQWEGVVQDRRRPQRTYI